MVGRDIKPRRDLPWCEKRITSSFGVYYGVATLLPLQRSRLYCSCYIICGNCDISNISLYSATLLYFQVPPYSMAAISRHNVDFAFFFPVKSDARARQVEAESRASRKCMYEPRKHLVRASV